MGVDRPNSVAGFTLSMPRNPMTIIQNIYIIFNKFDSYNIITFLIYQNRSDTAAIFKSNPFQPILFLIINRFGTLYTVKQVGARRHIIFHKERSANFRLPLNADDTSR